ncbi:MAG: TIR domain-containing protein [Hyphomicrobiaceae bacterium]
MQDNFVFVSHANKDKPLLREVVEALLDAGLKVWLDRPAGLGYSASEVETLFYRLRAGGRWEDEIDEAKRKAGCILVCWSKRAEGDEALMRHPVWFEEAAHGRTEEKLVSCRIDDLDVSKLPRFSAQQMPDARNVTERDLVVSDIRRVMERTAARSAGRRRSSGRQRSPMAPYLANRSHQEDMVVEAIEELGRSGGVRPFFIAGPENECLDEFLKRLEEHSSRRCLGGNMGWEALEVTWPVEDVLPRFAELYGRRVGSGIGRRARLSARELADALSERGRPVAVISRLRAEDWKDDAAARVRAWLGFWQMIAEQPGGRVVIPILSLKMPKAKPGWKGVPSSGWLDASGRRNKMIWDEMGKLAGEFAALGVGRPAVLGPVPSGDVDAWASAHFSLEDEDRAKALDGIAKLFRVREYNQFGVPHADLAAVMLPFFRGA